MLLVTGPACSSSRADSACCRVLLRRVRRAGLRLYSVLKHMLPGSVLTTFVKGRWADGSRGSPTILEVQPAAGRSGAYVTAKPRSGSFFSFGFETDGRLLLVERRADDHELVLFPARFHSGDLPQDMVNQYSHWLSDRMMLFRPRTVASNTFEPRGVEAACPSLVDVDTCHLTKACGSSMLVDVRRSSFGHLYNTTLCRLADRRDVHVWRAAVGRAVTVALPRLRLHLEVEEHRHLDRSPFFVDDADDRLKRLQPTAPNRTALLYLALLHVWTSGVLADPFAGLAGAEAGLRLLQGGNCSSNAPASPRDVEL
ncbi:hypothetical protein MMPV_004907 [Pyropia vietnamensis]